MVSRGIRSEMYNMAFWILWFRSRLSILIIADMSKLQRNLCIELLTSRQFSIAGGVE